MSGGRKRVLTAVDDVSFSIAKGQTYALVGESGSGKSTIARMIVGLERPDSGRILIDGQTAFDEAGGQAQDDHLRQKLQMVFQSPYSSLNPRWRVGDILMEPIKAFGLIRERGAQRRRVDELLEQVGLSSPDAARFPHEFSGGQRQRVAIARALVNRPEIVVCDEPTSALDVSVQSQILNLLNELRAELNLTYIIISHNLAVVEHIASRVAVMYLGRIVEQAETSALFRNPQHLYTRALLDSVLTPAPRLGLPNTQLGASYPNPIDPPSGCAFHPRCANAMPHCAQAAPNGLVNKDTYVECHLYSDGDAAKAG